MDQEVVADPGNVHDDEEEGTDEESKKLMDRFNVGDAVVAYTKPTVRGIVCDKAKNDDKYSLRLLVCYHRKHAENWSPAVLEWKKVKQISKRKLKCYFEFQQLPQIQQIVIEAAGMRKS